MTGLEPGARAAIAVLAVAFVAFGVTYHRRQNRGGASGKCRLGGAISRAKVMWLCYALFVWFFLCPIVALSGAVAEPLRALLGAFAAFMWLRGVIEAVLLYWTKSWTPPMGIGHDLACLALLGGGAWWFAPALGGLTSSLDLWTLGLLAAVFVSLLCEVGYAWAFFRVVGQETKGDEAVWFASEEDPRFRAINRATMTMNVPLYGFLVVYLLRCFDAF